MNRRTFIRAAGGIGALGLGMLTRPWNRALQYDVDLQAAIRSGAPLEIEADILDGTASPFDPATVVLGLRNTGDDDLVVTGGPPAPFGIVRLKGTAGEILLWSEAYEASEHLRTIGGTSVRQANDVAIETVIPPGELVTERYALRWRNLETGDYTLSEPPHVEVPGPDGARYDTEYELVATIER